MRRFLFALIATLAGSQAVMAAPMLLASDPGTGTTTTFTTTGNNGIGNPGPVTINGFSVTGNPQATYGDANYGLVGNGYWSQSWVATNNATGTVTFDLGVSATSAGAFLNYAPGFGTAPTITAIAPDGTTIVASFDLAALAPISTPGGVNAGAFRGISSDTPFRYFQIGGSYILVHNLEVTPAAAPPAATPEPATLAAFGALAAFGLGYSRRRLKGARVA